jgi:hypothetical protein
MVLSGPAADPMAQVGNLVGRPALVYAPASQP